MDNNVFIKNEELKTTSRDQLNIVQNWMTICFFIYFVIIFIANFTFSEFSPISNIYLNIIFIIAINIASGPFSLGFIGLYIKTIHGEKISAKNLFDGFRNFLKSFLLMFFLTLLLTLWSLLLIFPGIIKSLGYSMSFYIMYDNPSIKPLEAIKKSQIMMKGYKFKLFKLYLSFIGWALLMPFTFGLGLFWLCPYIGLSVGNFYINLKQIQENNVIGKEQNLV